MRRSLVVPFLAVAGVACADAATVGGRAGWLREAMWEDNRRIIDRDPAAARLGLRKIALDQFTFLRGTAQIFVLDQITPGQPAFRPTRYGSPAAARVRLVGDPHFENVGTYRDANGVLLVDFNDFDGATLGPYWLDVRRLALSYALIGRMADGHGATAADGEAAARAVAEGYAAEIAGEAAGGPAAVLHAGDSPNPIWVDLLGKAEENGSARGELDDYTRVGTDGVRRMFYGVVEPRVHPELPEDEVVALSAAEERLVRALLTAYPATLRHPERYPAAVFAVKGISRRLGAGVKSYPLLRYYALVEGPTTSQDDDWLLELKEEGDPLRFPGWDRPVDRLYHDNGERVVDMQRRLQETPEDDPLLGWAAAAPMVFRVRDRTKYQRGLDVYRVLARLDDGTWSAADLVDAARTTGRLLAAAHGRAAGLDGEPALRAIAEALGGDGAGFADETVAFVDGYLPQLLADQATFVGLLEAEPLLR